MRIQSFAITTMRWIFTEYERGYITFWHQSAAAGTVPHFLASSYLPPKTSAFQSEIYPVLIYSFLFHVINFHHPVVHFQHHISGHEHLTKKLTQLSSVETVGRRNDKNVRQANFFGTPATSPMPALPNTIPHIMLMDIPGNIYSSARRAHHHHPDHQDNNQRNYQGRDKSRPHL